MASSCSKSMKLDFDCWYRGISLRYAKNVETTLRGNGTRCRVLTELTDPPCQASSFVVYSSSLCLRSHPPPRRGP